MNAQLVRSAIVLGLLSLVGPLAIDMYLPALPAIGVALHANTAQVQQSLMAYMAAVAVCQLIYGPLSDMLGRKLPLYFGLGIFIVGSVGAALAPSAEWLVLARFVQGVGACASMSLPRAIVRDQYTGAPAAQLMSLIMLVFSVSPILAPLSGSALIVPFGWRAVFGAVGIAALLAMVLVATLLPETRPVEDRIGGGLRSVFGSFGELLQDWHFLGLIFIGGLGISSFFAFLSTSSFVYIGHYGLTPTQYSLAFSVNAIGFIGASQFAGPLGGRFGMKRVVMAAVSGFAGFAVVLLALTLAGFDSLFVLMPLLFVAFAFLGLVIPSTMVLSLENHGRIAGIASALGGTLQMVTGAAITGVASLFFDGTSRPMVATIAVIAIAAFAVAFVTLRKPEMEPVAAE
jgi:DHA1 family bicyclomycin/chloramphenicol resistance-like MFS transporter